MKIQLPRTRTSRLLGGLLLLLLCLSRPAAAQQSAAPTSDLVQPTPDVDQAQMQSAMHSYFRGERQGGIWLMAVGAPAIALGAGLSATDSDFARGMAISLIALGAAELIGGVSFYRNSLRRVPRFEQQIRSDPAAYRDTEQTRMRRVHREMHLLEIVELSFIMAGGAMTAIGSLQHQDLVSGLGTGLLLQATVLLIYDQLAARRADRYADRLLHFNVAIAPSSATGPTALLSATGRFR